jgi:transcriptional regulator with PAS, ATPase and Fis domain
LRVLQEGVYTPLGSSETIRADFRLVASSKAPLDVLMADGRLRQDLFYRLQVVTVEIPPLRKRPEDILALARRFIDREALQANSPRRALSKEAAEALVDYKWPGNVRELEQAIRRAILIGDNAGPILPEELFNREKKKKAETVLRGDRRAASSDSLEDSEILSVLERCQWNRTKAAEELGIPRRTFYRKIQKMGLGKKQGLAD